MTLETLDPTKPEGSELISLGAGRIRETRQAFIDTLQVQHDINGVHKIPQTMDPAAFLGGLAIVSDVLNLNQNEGWREVSGGNVVFGRGTLTNFVSGPPKIPIFNVGPLEVAQGARVIMFLSACTKGTSGNYLELSVNVTPDLTGGGWPPIMTVISLSGAIPSPIYRLAFEDDATAGSYTWTVLAKAGLVIAQADCSYLVVTI